MGKSIEVILLEDVPELGRSGDACRVRAGYARNFLFPHLCYDRCPSRAGIAIGIRPGKRGARALKTPIA